MSVAMKRIEAPVSMDEQKTILEERVEHIQSDIADIKQDVRRIDERLDTVRRELTADMKAMGSKLDGDIRDLREDNKLLREKIDANHADTQAKSEKIRDELGARIDSSNEKIAATNEKIAGVLGMQKAILVMIALMTGLIGTLLAVALKAVAGAD
jgi:predicted  nucleic acid-binding Zn-ribbon protein